MTDQPDLTAAQAAAQLGIGLSTCLRALAAGEIPRLKIGGRWVIPADRFERWRAGLEDAAGRPLVDRDLPGQLVALPPADPPSDRETALSWLRGLQAAIALVADTAEPTDRRSAGAA